MVVPAKGLTNALPVALAKSAGLRGAACRVCSWVLCLTCGLLPCVAAPAADPPAARSPIRGRVLQEARRTATIHWDRVPLCDALARLTNEFGEPVIVDRRVDPNARVSLDVQAASLDEALAPVAAVLGLGVSRLGRLTYLGPQPAAEQLRTLAAVRGEEMARLPADSRGPLLRKQRLTWPRLTEPRGLVTSLIQQRGWRVSHAEKIPHDLWPAGGLPELTLAEQLTALLIGFDLTFTVRPRERALEIAPLAGPLTLRRQYRLPSTMSDAAAVLRQQLPTAQAHVEGGMVSVDARVEDHEWLVEWLRGQAARPRPARQQQETKQLYTLRVEEQPVRAVLRELAERLNWTIDADEASIRAVGLSLDQHVSFAVDNVEQDELLEAVLRPAGLDYRREGDRLRIVPRDATGE